MIFEKEKGIEKLVTAKNTWMGDQTGMLSESGCTMTEPENSAKS